MNLNRKSIVMVFDVETTGLLNMKNGVTPVLDACPWVLQCSYILYDVEHCKVIKTMNSYVKIPEYVVIPPESTAIHGITRVKCDAGRYMVDILTEFYNDYHRVANVLVAHNYKFDTTLLNIEYRRNWPYFKELSPYALNIFQLEYMEEENMKFICTMDSTRNLCKIPFPDNGQGRVSTGYKWPTLLELYKHLFHTTPDNLHDSMMDCMVCLRCLLKVSETREMEEKEFGRLVDSVFT